MGHASIGRKLGSVWGRPARAWPCLLSTPAPSSRGSGVLSPVNKHHERLCAGSFTLGFCARTRQSQGQPVCLPVFLSARLTVRFLCLFLPHAHICPSFLSGFLKFSQAYLRLFLSRKLLRTPGDTNRYPASKSLILGPGGVRVLPLQRALGRVLDHPLGVPGSSPAFAHTEGVFVLGFRRS